MPQIPKSPLRFGFLASDTHKKYFIGAWLCVVTAAVMGNVSVIFLRNITDSLVGTPVNYDELWRWAGMFLLFYIGRQVIWRSSGFLGMRWFTYFYSYAHQRLYDYIALHSKDYFNSRFAGSLSNKISNAVDGSAFIFEKILWKFTELSLDLIVYFTITWISSPTLGTIFGVWAVVFLFFNYILSYHLHFKSKQTAESRSVMRGKIIDSLSNISLVHESANYSYESKYLGSYFNNQRKLDLSEWTFSEWIFVFNGLLIFAFTSLMLISSIYLLQAGIITAGVIVMVLAIVQDISHQLFVIGQEMKEVAKNYGQAKEGLDEVLKKHDITDRSNARNIKLSSGDIEFKNVEFGYDNIGVFKNFSLSIEHGQKIGLVGKSGAGKSTFVSLLLRHYEPQKGAIFIDKNDISGITLESLRKSIAFVPQDTSLFHRTVGENISFTKPHATKAEIVQASKLALADTFIQKLPKKYDTLVGERGVKLSGGQRQRIAIARAFLKDAPILILDEATSSLDSESESAIQNSLEKLMANRTVIAIAHRLSTLAKMDRILVIENGKVKEDGKPHELLEKKNSIFKSLWDRQVSGFIVED